MSNLRMRLFLVMSVFFLPARGKEQFAGSFSLHMEYDSNVFCLAPSELEIFIRRGDTVRFPYRSADDIDFVAAGDLAVRFSRITLLRFRFKGHQYFLNQDKSYGHVGMQFEHTVTSAHRLFFFYRWLPNYLIRHYRVIGSGRYYPCRFSEQYTGVKLEQRLGKVRVVPNYQLEYYDYVTPFKYYNTLAHRFGFTISWRQTSSLRFLADYNFKLARAAARLPDISYRQHGVSLVATIRPQSFKRTVIGAEYCYEYRYYTAAETDPFHYRRIDQLHNVTLKFDYRLNFGTLRLWFVPEWRNVEIPSRQELEEIKQYRKFNVGIGITVALKSASLLQEGEE